MKKKYIYPQIRIIDDSMVILASSTTGETIQLNNGYYYYQDELTGNEFEIEDVSGWDDLYDEISR